MRFRIRIPLLLLLPGMIAAGCTIQPAPTPGKPAPDFSTTLLDGTPVSSQSLRGKVVVLDFWATWCPPCREGLPHLQAMSADPGLSKSGLTVMAVNESEDDGTVRDFLNGHHFGFDVVRDGNGSLGRTFDVSELPTTVVIGRDGIVRAIFTGYTRETGVQIENAVAAACGTSPR
jgi:peroxiredoxin